MKVFLDTNVAIDLMARREPFFGDAKEIFERAAEGGIELLMTPLSFANIFCLMRKVAGNEKAKRDLSALRVMVTIVPMNDRQLDHALSSAGMDFKDDLQRAAAEGAKADLIITRDTAGFKRSRIPVMTPAAFVRTL